MMEGTSTEICNKQNNCALLQKLKGKQSMMNPGIRWDQQ